MAPAILSSLGEQVLHSNSLATITESWIVVRDFRAQSESLISIARISGLKTRKSSHLIYLACASGCFLITLATLFSPEPGGATLPFCLAGLVLLTAAQASGQVALAIMVDSEVGAHRFWNIAGGGDPGRCHLGRRRKAAPSEERAEVAGTSSFAPISHYSCK